MNHKKIVNTQHELYLKGYKKGYRDALELAQKTKRDKSELTKWQIQCYLEDAEHQIIHGF